MTVKEKSMAEKKEQGRGPGKKQIELLKQYFEKEKQEQEKKDDNA